MWSMFSSSLDIVLAFTPKCREQKRFETHPYITLERLFCVEIRWIGDTASVYVQTVLLASHKKHSALVFGYCIMLCYNCYFPLYFSVPVITCYRCHKWISMRQSTIAYASDEIDTVEALFMLSMTGCFSSARSLSYAQTRRWINESRVSSQLAAVCRRHRGVIFCLCPMFQCCEFKTKTVSMFHFVQNLVDLTVKKGTCVFFCFLFFGVSSQILSALLWPEC